MNVRYRPSGRLAGEPSRTTRLSSTCSSNPESYRTQSFRGPGVGVDAATVKDELAAGAGAGSQSEIVAVRGP